jgi:hypothetical protein
MVTLSKKERNEGIFNPEVLARTLDISTEDANMVSSEGKTYVFAKQKSTGKTIQIYHASLECNDLNIFVEDASKERMKEFNHKEWYNAPYAKEVGQTENTNHFVC